MTCTLDSHIGYWMRTLSNHVSHSFERKLAVKGVSVAEWVVLRLLFDGEAFPSQLAKQMGMTKGAISKVVDRLDSKGLLEIEAGIGDRRSQTLRLSDSGRSLTPVLAELADQNDAEFFGHLNEDERKYLLAIMRRLSDHANLNIIPAQ
ncbi:MAG: MarR family transcriptional regulator [Armatimonadetes bacterium]|nr:MarR family transcriptional regulator [Armatimonadota bacterium]